MLHRPLNVPRVATVACPRTCGPDGGRRRREQSGQLAQLTLMLSADGSSSFPASLTKGSAYAVTSLIQPSGHGIGG